VHDPLKDERLLMNPLDAAEDTLFSGNAARTTHEEILSSHAD
jgi:hypothetical protein